MGHGRGPGGAGEGGALGVTDRDQRQLGVGRVQLPQPVEVQAPVQGGQERRRQVPEGRKRQVVEVRVHHVELPAPLPDQPDGAHVPGERVGAGGPVEAQGPLHDRHELGAGLRVAAREQHDLVAAAHELLDQPVHHAFRPAVERRRNRLVQRGELGDPHRPCSLELEAPPGTAGYASGPL